MKRVFVFASSTLVMATLVLALVFILPVQAKVVENVKIPFGPIVVLGCVEPVMIEGTGHVLVSLTDDGNGGFHGNFHGNFHFTGVGLFTGGQYVANEKVHENLNLGPGETFTVETAFKLIGQGALPDLTGRTTLKVTVNANGELTVIKESFKAECK